MAKSKGERLVSQSLIDRLTEKDWPTMSHRTNFDWPTTRKDSLEMYREGIKRDVEWLLNSRKPFVSVVDKYQLASQSVFNFGLQDLTQLRGHDPKAVLMTILQTVRTYEPRIREPRVYLVRSDVLARTLNFHVDGMLAFDDGDEDISFDTVLKVISGDYEVK